jgi:hypothetical protein
MCQSCLNKANSISSARFQEKSKRGECYYCDSPAVDGGRLCQLHIDRRKSYDKKRRQLGCDKCGAPKEKGCLCQKCWEKRTAYLKRKRERQVKESICQACSKPSATGRLCDGCRVVDRLIKADRRLIRKELGLCLTCGSGDPVGNRCLVCILKDTAHFHWGQRKLYPKLIEIFESQKGTCPYTGEKLTLGKNATLDHKIPKSRGGTSDLSNLQWVYKGNFDVNWMKGMLLEEEFQKAIVQIYRVIGEDKQ